MSKKPFKIRPGYLFPLGLALLFLHAWLGGVSRDFALARSVDVHKRQATNERESFATQVSTRVFINEIHYDNSGVDIGEGIELAGPAGIDLTGWRLVLYNGNGGTVYATIPITAILTNQGNGYGCIYIPISGLQNGAPDGIALVNANGTIVQFLSYEGVLAAANGPARGFLSTDIGVEENGADPVGYSLQLKGKGSVYEDFTWSSPAVNTFGAANAQQEFLPSSPAEAPQIGKLAPSYVNPAGLITYTLVAQNLLGFPLHQVTITDALPAGVAFAYALDGGVELNGIVTWQIERLDDGARIERRLVVTAPLEPRSIVSNQHYALSALEWSPAISGEAVYTIVGEYTPIPVIQGGGSASFWRNKPAKTQGVVTGFFQGSYPDGSFFNGFFLQDLPGDDDPQTSDGLFVNHGNKNVSLGIGDLVEVSGMVQEFNEHDGSSCQAAHCLTQLAIAGSASLRVIGSGQATAALLNPPGDPGQAFEYFEAHEGMLVHFPGAAAVTGPTSFGVLSILPESEGVRRVMHGSPQEGMTFGLRHWERAGDINGQNAPGLITGSVVEGVKGPLIWSYDDYLVITQPGEAWTVLYSQPPPTDVPTWEAPGKYRFSVATYNTYRLQNWGVQFTKVYSSILQLNAPTFLALQEVNPSTALPALTDRLRNVGYEYEYTYSHPDVSGYGQALLWRKESVTDVSWSIGYQTCSVHGSPSSSYDALWETCRSRGEYPLFARRPIVVTGTVGTPANQLPLILIAGHLKSRVEGESSEQRRLEEAHFIGKLVEELISHGSMNVIVLGDLNDYEDSPALQALYSYGGLANIWYTIPEEERYSFIYQGVSQALDHILAMPSLASRLSAAGALHLNADFPYSPYARNGQVIWRSSDHDPVAASFFIWRNNQIFLPLMLNR